MIDDCDVRINSFMTKFHDGGLYHIETDLLI